MDQNQSDEAEANAGVKSWGFRRTTIARREFLDEVGDLYRSPSPVRRVRSRRSNQTPQAMTETTVRSSQAVRSVLDGLEWSPPSSPVSQESKPASAAAAGDGGTLDSSIWKDCGSAFHTALSLLGGNDDLSMEMPDALALPDNVEAPEAIEASPPQVLIESDTSDHTELSDVIEIPLPQINDVVMISSQEEDTEESALMEVKEQDQQEDTAARGRKGRRGKARGRARGRGRGRAKGKGRGKNRGVVVEIADDEDSEDDLVFGNAFEKQQEAANDPLKAPADVPPDISLSPAQQLDSDMLIIDGSSVQIADVTAGQYDDALQEQEQEEEEEEKEMKKDDSMNAGDKESISDYNDPDALYCICRQKQNDRFMICCDSCREWFHGDCVGITKTQGRKMERSGQEFICPPCTTKKQSQLQTEPRAQTEEEEELSFTPGLTLDSPGDEQGGQTEPQDLKETAATADESEEPPPKSSKPEPEEEMEAHSSLPLCIGPGCSQQALPDSVYCGPNCILQHAAITMKNLSGTKVPKSRRTVQRKAATARPTARGQRPTRVSKRLAEKVEEEEMEEEEVKEQGEEQKEAESPSACDPSLTDVQTTSLPASNIYTTSTNQLKADSEDVTPPPEETSTNSTPSSQPVTEPGSPQIHSSEISKEPLNIGVTKEQSGKSKEPLNSGETKEQPTISKEPQNIIVSKEQSTISEGPQNIVTKEQSTKFKEQLNIGVIKEQSTELKPCTPHGQAKCGLSPAAQSPSTSAPRLHETGAVLVHKTGYVIPKKPSASQPPSNQISASASSLKLPSTPVLMSETRNLPVPPAPSAPSSRPSQPNNQVRQSIQRSLTGILFKRVCDCEDLEMSESEAAKLVASIEAEMFDIFRNTDSKYMNKYRTIMFNLKDPRNKGLLYGIVSGEISPFRLSRMSQKDMQAIKASEPSAKETPEVKDASAKATTVQYVPEAVKVDLPSLNPARAGSSTEQKKNLPAPAPKTITSPPSQSTVLPDVLACMLKDTTSEHKTHIFDLKCKICTGQIHQEASKKSKVPEKQDKYESPQRTPAGAGAGDDSPLLAPPDSPDMDSPTSTLTDSSPRLIIDCPSLTIIESPASPVMDPPRSPALDSSVSSAVNSPASLALDTSNASKATTTKRPYTPVVIPAVSTITFTRRDPRTAASRFSAVSGGTPGPSNTTLDQSVPFSRHQEMKLEPPSNQASSLPPTKPLPKSILMKPSSSADPRLYAASSRTMISESPAHDETAQFLTKQDIVWKGFLNMVTVAKFVTKGYLVSGSAENLKADLPGTIEIGGRILPQTVWDYVGKVKTSVTKELCVIRFHPATEEEEVAYVSLFSYFSSRNRFGVVANNSHSIKDVYLVPLGAKESIPSILQPLKGPGFEKNRPNLLLALVIIQKTKRPGIFPPEIEEKRPKVHMPKDPMWIPKPPVLYGSDKLEIFQPYDPETPASTSPSASPDPSLELPSTGSVTVPSLVTSASATVAATQSTTNITEKNVTTASSNGSSLQTILKSLFKNNQTDSTMSSDQSSTTTETSDKKPPVFSQVSGSMADPIVQQYGQKSKIKEMEEEENEFDRPYDPEEEYDPATGFGTVASQSSTAVSDVVDNDVAYDPEDETIFVDIQSGIAANVENPGPNHTTDPQPGPIPVSTKAIEPVTSLIPAQSPSPAGVTQNHPTGTVVVSAATLSEQQRMLEELNKQIEEQKRQLKEQEEALRQQREAVGMFMARFSVADTLMSPPSKAFTPNQLSSLQSGLTQTHATPSQSTDKTSSVTEMTDSSEVDSHAVKLEDTTAIPNSKNDNDSVMEQGEILEVFKESDKYSSAGEIEDSDVAYDPEDESLFNEIQEEVFQKTSTEAHDSCHKSTLQSSYHSRRRRPSPKRRRHHEKDRHRSPSRKSQRRSPSHSQRRREKDRHRRSERDRSRHRSKEQSERHGRHRREHSARRHSHGRRRSSSPPGLESLSPEQNRVPSPQHLEIPAPSHNTNSDSDNYQLKCSLVENPDKDISHSTHQLIPNVKLEVSETPTPQELQKESSSVQGDTTKGFPSQLDTLETYLKNKIESTIPLREIDPPIRDSPQSPDPEPQFLSPFSTEKKEKMKDSETNTSFSNTLVKVEENCSPISSVEVSNIQASETVDPVTGQGIQSVAAEKKEYGHFGTQAYLRKPGILSSVSGPHIPNFSLTESELKEHKLAPPVTNPHIVGFGAQNEKKEPDMEDQSLGRPALEIKGSEAWEPSSTSHHPSPDTIRFIGVVARKAPDLSCPQTEGRAADVGSLRSQKYRGDSPNIEVVSCAVRDGDPGTGDSPAIANQRWDLQRAGDVPMAKTESNINFERRDFNRFHFGESKSGTGEHFNKAQSDRAEGVVPGSDMSKSDMHKLRGPDMIEEGSLRPRQYLRGVGFSDTGYERVPFSDTTERDWRGPGSDPFGPDIRGQRGQESVPGSQRRDPGWCGSGSDINNDWKGSDKRRPGLVREGQLIQDELGVNRLDKRNPKMEDMSHDRRRPQGPNFIATGHLKGGIDREAPVYDRREPGGPHFMGPVPERTISHTDIPVHDRRGPGRPDYRPDLDRKIKPNDNQGPGVRGPGGPDIVRADVERRALHMDGPRSNRRGPAHPGFRGQEPESMGLSDGRRPGSPNFRRPGPERTGLAVESPGIDRRPEGCDFRGRGLESRDPSVDYVGPDRRGPEGHSFNEPSGRSDRRELGGHFEEQGPERRHLAMHEFGRERRQNDQDLRKPMSENRDRLFPDQVTDRRGPYTAQTMDDPGHILTRQQGGSHFKSAWPDGAHHNMEVPRPDIREPRPERPDTGMADTGLRWREPKGPILRQPGPHCLDPNREGPILDMEVTGDRFFAKGPHRAGPGINRKGTRSPDFRGPGCESRDLHMRDLEPDRAEPRFRGPGCDGSDQNIRDLGPDRAERGGSGFREHWPEWRGPGSDWRRPGGHGFGGPSISQEDPNIEGPRHGEGEWDRAHFGGSEREEDLEGLDVGRPGPERKNRSWGPEPMSRNIRGSGSNLNRGGRQRGPDFSGTPCDRRGEGTEERWSDRRGHNYEDTADERDRFGNDWKRHGPSREDEEGYLQEHRQGSFTEWRGPENSDSKPIQRPNMPFDDWGGSHFRGSESLRDDPNMVGPGSSREGPENEWREPDCVGAGPNRLGPRQNPGNRGRGHSRRGTRFRGAQSDMRGGPDMRNEWRQSEYRDDMRRQNFECHATHRDDLDLRSSNTINMESFDRKGPKGPEVRPENRDLEGPGPDGRFTEWRGLGPDRRDLDVENPEIDRKEFRGYSRGKRGSGMRRLRPNTHGMRVSGPESPDVSHESQRWNINSQGRELDSRGAEPVLPHFVHRPEVERFQDPRDLHSAPYTGPDQVGKISGPGFVSFENQQMARPQRHKGALLPTPTGLLRAPNHMMNNPNILRPK